MGKVVLSLNTYMLTCISISLLRNLIPLVLGFDTEWRVTWLRGPERPTALIQLATENEGGIIYLIQVSAMTRAYPTSPFLHLSNIEAIYQSFLQN